MLNRFAQREANGRVRQDRTPPISVYGEEIACALSGSAAVTRHGLIITAIVKDVQAACAVRTLRLLAVFVSSEAVVDAWKAVRVATLERGVAPAAKHLRNRLKDWLKAYVLRKVTIEIAATFQKVVAGVGAGEFDNFRHEEGGLYDA